jgi:hypothetical protein
LWAVTATITSQGSDPAKSTIKSIADLLNPASAGGGSGQGNGGGGGGAGGNASAGGDSSSSDNSSKSSENGGGNNSSSGLSGRPVSVPEPGTFTLLLAASVVGLARRPRRAGVIQP